jgi:hypothetical protein
LSVADPPGGGAAVIGGEHPGLRSFPPDYRAARLLLPGAKRDGMCPNGRGWSQKELVSDYAKDTMAYQERHGILERVFIRG